MCKMSSLKQAFHKRRVVVKVLISLQVGYCIHKRILKIVQRDHPSSSLNFQKMTNRSQSTNGIYCDLQ